MILIYFKQVLQMAEERGKEDERGKIPSFETIKLEDLEVACDKALAEKKYLFIADMSGKAATFFQY